MKGETYMVMKVSEIPYKRYTIEEGRSAFGSFKAAVAAAGSADDVIAARKTFLDEWRNYAEAASLSKYDSSYSFSLSAASNAPSAS